MKIDKIVVIDRCMMLGIFRTSTFQELSSRKGIETFGNFSTGLMGVIEEVNDAAGRYNQIIFVLDDIQFPISTGSSFTCMELELICNNEEFFNKTIFVKGENVIEFDKNLVLN